MHLISMISVLSSLLCAGAGDPIPAISHRNQAGLADCIGIQWVETAAEGDWMYTGLNGSLSEISGPFLKASCPMNDANLSLSNMIALDNCLVAKNHDLYGQLYGFFAKSCRKGYEFISTTLFQADCGGKKPAQFDLANFFILDDGLLSCFGIQACATAVWGEPFQDTTVLPDGETLSEQPVSHVPWFGNCTGYGGGTSSS
ncbi:hypothetical protein F5Y16DRAFT_375586 [Xylariaceae sp. FL0255]|nr:hypothetical protein F5Y16DRAFT_375586 [Xylariaceae sp. FL0255]